MTAVLHTLFSGGKKPNDWKGGHLKPEHYRIEALKDNKEALGKVQKNKRPGAQQGQIQLEKFKEWRMPEQSGGYIKAKKNGML